MSCQCEAPFIRCDQHGCRCVQCGEPERSRISPGLQAAIDETRRKIAEAPVQGVEAVAVKPLEWSEIERDRGDGQTDKLGEWEAPSIVGVYAINISTCGDMHAPWEVFGGDDGKIGNFLALDEAKAAAQADYEARIRSALLPREAPAAVAEAVPYAHEFGRSNGDGTFSVVIERGEPKRANDQWPIKPLYASPAPAPEALAETTYAARFERLAGICRRLRWVDAVTPAMNNPQTLEALSDLAEWLFSDGMDQAIQKRDAALATQADATKGDA